MNKLSVTCIEIDADHDGFVVIRFEVVSLDPQIYASGQFGIQVFTADGYEVGKQYDLALNEIQ